MPNCCCISMTIKCDPAQIEWLKTIFDEMNTLDEHGHNPVLKTMVPRPSEEDDNWYAWNNSNWGTKWDVRDCTLSWEDNKIEISAWTAWAPPIQAIETFEENNQSHEVSVRCVYDEGGNEIYGVYEDGSDYEAELPETSCDPAWEDYPNNLFKWRREEMEEEEEEQRLEEQEQTTENN